MFSEKLTRYHIENRFIKPYERLEDFNIIYINNKLVVEITYKNIINNKILKAFFTDFESNICDSEYYIKFMYNIFGNDYKDAYFKYITDKLFN